METPMYYRFVKYMLEGAILSAYAYATCKSRKVGALLVDHNTDQVIGTGWNGPPYGVLTCQEGCSWHHHKRAFRTDLSGCPSVHAEVRALLHGLENAPRSVPGSALYCGCGVPCGNCLKHLIEAGVAQVVVTHTEGIGLWYESLSRTLVKSGRIWAYQFRPEVGPTGEFMVQITGEED